MEIANALRAAAAEAGWSAAKVAAEVGTTEVSAKSWMKGKFVPSGDKLIILQRVLPGFAKRLGFEAVSRAA